jgi:hypothetical protein
MITWTMLGKKQRGLFRKPLIVIRFWARAHHDAGEFIAGQSTEIEVEEGWHEYMMFGAQARFPHLVAEWDALCAQLIDDGWELITKTDMDNWWTYAFRR